MRLKSAFLPVSAVLLLLLASNFLPPATASHASGVPGRSDWDGSRVLPPPRAAQPITVPFQGAHLLPHGGKLQEAGLAYAVFDDLDL